MVKAIGEIEYTLDLIEESKYTPTEIEERFLHSLRDMCSEGKYPTSRQVFWLMAIYGKATGGGRYQRQQRI